MNPKATQRKYLALTVIAYVLLAFTYALATPPLEASDEYKHYPVVQHLQTTGTLPILDPENPGLWLQSAVQPPLYFILVALITAGIDSGDLPDIHQENPHAYVGDPNQIYNKNLIIHQADREQFPWQGAILAIYIARFVTIFLGIGTILLVSRLGEVLFNPQVAIVAAVLTAFNPMFIFISTSVNNDGLAALLGMLGLYLLVMLWRDEPDPVRGWLRYFTLGLVLGLAILTKLSLAGLLLLAGISLAVLTWRRRQWKYLLFGGSVVLLVALAVAAPWLIHNLRHYQDPSALNVFLEVQAQRAVPLSFQDWIEEFGTLYRTFWGLFGGVNVAAPELFYNIYNILFVAGTAGFGYWLWRHWRNRQKIADGEDDPAGAGSELVASTKGLWFLLAWTVIVLLLLIRWNFFAQSFQGRLLFPALGAVNVLWAAGLLACLPQRFRNKFSLLLAMVFFIMAALLPWIAIRPAYAYPEPLTTIPEEALFGPITFRMGDGEIQLVGVEVPPDQSVRPGESPIEVILYWSALDPVEKDYLSIVHLLGRKSVSVGFVNRYPGWGMIPTSQWQPGQIWRDVYHVYVGPDAEAPSRLRIKAGLFDPDTDRDVDAFSPDGELIDLLLVGEARLASGTEGELKPETALEVALAEGITLSGYDLEPLTARTGDSQRLFLHWLAAAKPSKDFTVFVHLLDENGNQVTGADNPPVFGDYPTSLWQEGDTILDEHILQIPAGVSPGTYHIAVGLYDPATLARVPRLDGTGDTISWPVTVAGGG
jgi:4-amino-4-deoxy-L-arabinose transferase-like glycosyltransferase